MENLEKETENINITLEKRKQKLIEKITNWLKNPYNLIFFIVFIIILIIRFYYFWLTRNQPVWWDEAEYLASAKHYAGIFDFSHELSEQRLPGFPLLISVFFRLGITNELVLRFLLVFLPSIIAIFLLYFLLIKMYSDKKIALISMVIFGVLWEHLFYSNRFHTENPALIFEFLAIIVLFQAYMKKENFFFIKPKSSLIWVILFSILSMFFRPGNLLFIPSVFVFFLILNQSFFLSQKRRIYFIAILITLFIFSIFFLSILPKVPLLRTYYHPDWPIGWSFLSVFKGFYEPVISWMPSILYFAFVLGIFIVLFNTLIVFDKILRINKNSEELEFKSNLYNLILIILVLSIFIFFLRIPEGSTRPYEFRWFFIFLPAMLAFTSKGIIVFSEFISKILNIKNISLLIIIIILAFGAYNQLVHADGIIKNKLDSYIHIKEASLWSKYNSNEKDILFGRSVKQIAYYSDRKTYSSSSYQNESSFFNALKNLHPKYYIEYIYEGPLLDYILNPSENLRKVLKPVRAWFLDKEQKQPVSIVYEIDYNELDKFQS